jgi:hypothetical protein
MRANAKLAMASFWPLVMGMFLSHAKRRGRPRQPRVVSDDMAACGRDRFGLTEPWYRNTPQLMFLFQD